MMKIKSTTPNTMLLQMMVSMETTPSLMRLLDSLMTLLWSSIVQANPMKRLASVAAAMMKIKSTTVNSFFLANFVNGRTGFPSESENLFTQIIFYYLDEYLQEWPVQSQTTIRSF